MRAWIAVLLLMVGCTGGERVYLDLPSGSEDSAAIVAVVLGERTIVEAVDLAATTTFEMPLEPGESGRIEWLTYPMKATGHPAPGPLDLADDGEIGTQLPTPAATFHAELDDGVATPWMPGPVSAEISDLRMRATGCRMFVPASVSLDGADHIRFVMPVGDRIYLASRDGRAFVASEPNVVEEIVMTPTVAVTGGHFHESGAWIYGRGGDIYRVTAGAGLTLETHIPSAEINTLSFGDGPESDMFVLGFFGELLHYDGSSWSLIEQRGDATRGGVVSIGPREAIIGSGLDTDLTRVRGMDLERIPVSDVGISTVRRFDDGTIYIASGQGRIHRLRLDGEPELVGQSPIRLDVYAIHQTASGFLIGGANGLVAEYLEGVGFCPAQPLGIGGIREITVIGDGYLLTGDRPGSDTSIIVTFIHPVE